MATRIRLDELVVARGMAPDLKEARARIIAGEIWVDGQRGDKAGASLPPGVSIEHRPRRPVWVSRAGEKLAGALDAFEIEVAGLVCLDLGASTGGFTDCLLQHGARRVYAVDVGRGQLDWQLANDDRVKSIEGCNARFLTPDQIEERPQLITADLSFISLRLILPAIRRFAPASALLLVKPQFEARPEEVEPGGLVRDPDLREEILSRVEESTRGAGFEVLGRVDSTLKGRRGNLEAFLWLAQPRGCR